MAEWFFDFQSKGGTEYRVEIEGFATELELTGGDNPIETQEDETEDMFVPVRLQTGYLRILDETGGLMQRLMPATATSHPVKLWRKSDSVVLWRGYIKQDSYAGDVEAWPNVIDVPIVCQLSALEAFDAEIEAGGVPNIAGLLYYALSQAGQWSRIYIQGTDGVGSWLTARALSSCFYERSSLMQMDYKYNCLELVEEVCNFLGLTARTCGNDLWLCAADADVAADGWQWLTLAQLGRIADGYSVSAGSASWSARDADDIFADVTSQVVYVNGIRKASVEGDVDEVDVLMEYPEEQINAIMEQNPSTDGNVSETQYGSQLHVFRRRLLSKTWVDDALAEWSWDGNWVYPICEDTYTGSLANKHSMAWTWYFRMPTDGQEPLTMITHDAVWLVPGVLELAGTTEWRSYSTSGDGSVTTYPANGTMDVRIKCGDMYYDQSGGVGNWWTPYEVWNTIAIGDELGGNQGVGRIICNRDWHSTGPNYSGHGFPIDLPRVGRLEVSIRRVSITGETNKTVYMGDLKVAFHALSVEESPTRCTATNGTDYRAAESKDVIFSTAAGVYGKGTLMNEDCSALGLLEYRGTLKRPEQWLADRIAQYGNGVREVLRYVIDASQVGADLTPAVKLNADSITRWAMSVSHRWWNDEATVVMTEV